MMPIVPGPSLGGSQAGSSTASYIPSIGAERRKHSGAAWFLAYGQRVFFTYKPRITCSGNGASSSVLGLPMLIILI